MIWNQTIYFNLNQSDAKNISHSSRNYFWEVLKKMSVEYVNKICQEFQFIWMTWMCHVNMKNEGKKLTIMESMYAHKILLNGFFYKEDVRMNWLRISDDHYWSN